MRSRAYYSQSVRRTGIVSARSDYGFEWECDPLSSGYLREKVCHEIVTFRFEAYGNRPARGFIDARVALGVDSQRHRVAMCEKWPGCCASARAI